MKKLSGWELFYSDTNELVKAAKNSSGNDKENNQPKSE